MRCRLLLALVALPALTSCGTSSTKTVTKLAPPPVTSTASPPVTTSSTTTTTSSTITTAQTTTNATTPTQTSGPVFFQGVLGRPRQRPSSLQLTGDGTLFVGGTQWTSWGGPEATGSGNAEYHGCTPNCAQAPVHNALVSIRLVGIRVCSGRRYYSGVVLTLNSGQLLDKQFLQRSWSPC